MQYYFNKFQWKNTQIQDFLQAIEYGYNSKQENSKKINLSEWSSYWLEKPVSY